MNEPWSPSLGAVKQGETTSFTVWAPDATSLELMLDNRKHPLSREKDGKWRGQFRDVRAGDLYQYRLDGHRLLPDPASRFQPEGVHGPSQVIDPHSYRWSDQNWRGIRMEDAILYELHVGTFSPQGNFAGVQSLLPYLRDLGINVIELMPIGDFAGNRNWGYDGVALFAPAQCYGTPDDLRRLVDASHAIGIAILIDVVYNHFGPDGAYAPSFSRHYFTNRAKTFWGDAVNLDGPHSEMVRDFFIENALYWLHEFHIDGLRLDATHSMIDQSSRHFIAELSARVRNTIRDREILLIAEDHRNLADIVQKESWALDAVWSEDFHHEMRRLLAGDSEGYYRDYRGSVSSLETTFQKGWLFTGQYSEHYGTNRGTDPVGIPPHRFVFFLQNHDQVGNRAQGDRLHHRIDDATYRAASTLLLMAPQTPLLFMGQEWGASTPFCYFTDHHEELGRQVRAGRLKEFRHFSEFDEQIPDPQSIDTFLKSRLDWRELDSERQQRLLRFYRALIEIRKSHPIRTNFHVSAINENALLLQDERVMVVAQLKGSGVISLPGSKSFDLLLTTEDVEYCVDPDPIRMDGTQFVFARPGAVIACRGRSETRPAG